MISDDAVEIRQGTDVLAAGCVRLCGKSSRCQVCSRALGTAIGFTRVRVLTGFILNHGRPVGADYSLHQLGKILVDPDAWIELSFRPLPLASWRSKTKVASCETRWIIGGPYTGPEYASLGVASTLRSTRVTTSSPVACSRPSGVRTTRLEWKHTSVWLDMFSSQWLRNFPSSLM